MHPEQSAYFLTLTKNGGKGKQRVRLSGMIAQLIGNRIPSLVHATAADIYRQDFTAPYFV